VTRRGRTVVRVLATILLAGALLAAVRGLDPGTGPHEPIPDRDRVATPAWSARRAPFLVEELAGAQQRQRALDAALAPYDACSVTTATMPGAASDHRGEEALVPASTLKVLTAAAALEVLGADHRFVTTAAADAEPDAAGTLSGDLVLVGGGDPVLSTPEYEAYLRSTPRHRDDPVTALAALADALVARGLRRVEGSVLGDDSRHESLRYLPVWEPDYRDDGNIAYLSALTVDDANADFPGRAAADEPATHAASELASLLRARGVTITGGVGRTGTAERVELARVESAPLADIAAALIRSSDNQTGELLVRELGVATARDGSTAAGLSAVTAALERLGVPLDGARIVDGSGLSRHNRVSCHTLLAGVALGARPGFEALRSGLAVAGRTGTLAERMTAAPAAGRVRAKTGTLDGVTGLVGVVDGTHPLSFAMLAQGEFTEDRGEAIQAQVAAILAAPLAPGPDLAGPLVPPP
jgi:D-alanyl-D-alanine carboxypeptidase/D-alanyl-D-alanine-endopeptidase (penicillin-binding protein 4)